MVQNSDGTVGPALPVNTVRVSSTGVISYSGNTQTSGNKATYGVLSAPSVNKYVEPVLPGSTTTPTDQILSASLASGLLTITNLVDTERTARINADNNLSGLITQFQSQYITNNDANALVSSISSAKVSDLNLVLTNSTNTLSARIDDIEASYISQNVLNGGISDANAKIVAESIVRADADRALAVRISSIETDYTTYDSATGIATSVAHAIVSDYASAESDALGAIATRISLVEADYTTRNAVTGIATSVATALISDESIARANADGAIATRVSVVEADYTTRDAVTGIATNVATALISDASSASANALGAVANRVTIIEADYTTHDAVTGIADVISSAKVQTESTARANAIESLATQINTLSSTFVTNDAATGIATSVASALVSSEATARTDAVSALATRIDAIDTTYITPDIVTGIATTVAHAAVTQEATARSDADGALATQITNIQADYTTRNAVTGIATTVASSVVSQESSARADADGALSSRIDTISADYTTHDAVTGIATSVAAAKVSEEATARADADGALAIRIDSMTATYVGNSPNLLPDVSSWTVLNGVTYQVSPSWGAIISGIPSYTGRGDVLAYSPYINCTPLSHYTLSADFYLDASVGVSVAADIEYYDTSNTVISENGTIITDVDAPFASARSRWSATGSAPANALKMRIRFICTSPSMNDTYTLVGFRMPKLEFGDVSTPFTLEGESIYSNALIYNEQTTRADADGALSSRIDTISADYTTTDAATGIATSVASAKVSEEATARTNADGALASRIDTVSASFTVNSPNLLPDVLAWTVLNGVTYQTSTLWGSIIGGIPSFTSRGDVLAYSPYINCSSLSHYTLSADFYLDASPGVSVTADIEYYNSSNAVISENGTIITNTIGQFSSTRSRWHATGIAPTNAVTMRVRFIATSPSVNDTYNFVGIRMPKLELGDVATPYTQEGQTIYSNALIKSEQQTRSDADSALSSRIDTISADYTTHDAATGIATSVATAKVSEEATARADADGALSSRIDILATTYVVGGPNLVSDVDTWSVYHGISYQNNGSWGAILAGIPDYTNLGAVLAYSPYITCSPSTHYTLSGNFYLSASAGISAVSDIEYYDSSNTIIRQGGTIAAVPNTSFTNTRTAGHDVSPANALKMRIRFVVNSSSISDTYNFVGFRMPKLELGDVATPYSLEAQAIYANSAITSEQSSRATADSALSTRIDTVSSTFIINSPNLMPDVGSWDTFNGAYYDSSGSGVWGPIVGGVPNSTGTVLLASSPRITAFANIPYSMSADLQCLGTGQTIAVNLYFYDSNDVGTTTYTQISAPGVHGFSNDRQRQGATVTAPSNAAYMRIIVYSVADTGASLGFAGIRMPKIEQGSKITPYSIEGQSTKSQADIKSEQQTRSDADGALGLRIDTISADYTTTNAATGIATSVASAKVSEEATARANADGALSSRIDTISADYTTHDAVTGIATNVATAKVAEEATARSNADGALSSRIDTISADYVTNSGANNIANSVATAKVSDEATARANADGALSNRIDNVSASFTINSPNLIPDVGTWSPSNGAVFEKQNGAWGPIIGGSPTFTGTEGILAISPYVVCGANLTYTFSCDFNCSASAGVTSGIVFEFSDISQNVVAYTGRFVRPSPWSFSNTRARDSITVTAPTGAIRVRMILISDVPSSGATFTYVGMRMPKLEFGSVATAYSLEGQIVNSQTEIQTEETTRATADSALSNRITTIESDYTTTGTATGIANTIAQAKVNDEASTRASADSALSTRIDSISSTFVVGSPNLVPDVESWTTLYGIAYNLNPAWGALVGGIPNYNGRGDVLAYSPYLGCQPSGDFTLSADFYCLASTGVVIGADIEYSDINQTIIAYGSSINATSPWSFSNTRTRQSATSTAPSNAYYMRVRFICNAPAGATYTYVAFRMPKLEYGDVATPYSIEGQTTYSQAQITNESSTRATADSALSNRISSIEADYTTNAGANSIATSVAQAKVNDEATARSNADGALSNRIDSISASFTANSPNLISDVDTWGLSNGISFSNGVWGPTIGGQVNYTNAEFAIGVSPMIASNPYSIFALSCDFYCDASPGVTVSADIEFFDINTSPVGYSTRIYANAPYAFSNTRARPFATGTAPSTAVKMRMRFLCNAPAGATFNYIGFRMPKIELGNVATPYSIEGQGVYSQAAIVNEQNARADAVSAVASSVSTLSTNYGGLSSTVTTQAGAITSLQGKTSAYWTTSAVSGDNRAQISIHADANGGAGVDIIGDTNFYGNLQVGLNRSGARTEIQADQIRIYDSNNVLRVRLGIF